MVAGLHLVSRPAWLSLDAAERAVAAAVEDVASLLPESWRKRIVPRHKMVVIDASQDGSSIQAFLLDGRRMTFETPIDLSNSRDALRRHDVVLRLSDDEVLSTRLKLPRRAMSRLADVVTTNLSVWTPFAADELYFEARASSARPSTGDGVQHASCEVELRCVPKAAVARRLATLVSLSIDVDHLWLGSDEAFSCDLGSRRTQRARSNRRAGLALIALAAVQACALPMVYRMRQDDRIATLQSELDRVRQLLHARAAQVRTEMDAAQALTAIEAKANGQESMTFALNRLAAVLPAGARYSELNLNSSGIGSLTIDSGGRIDPVSLVAATGLLAVTEVNEMNAAQEGDHTYAVGFKAVRSVAAPN